MNCLKHKHIARKKRYMKKLHLLCNAHLDPVWMWEWEEGAAEAMSTFRTAADLCEEFDGFIFNHNEVTLYAWVEEFEPELFKRIQRLVKEGKWHIMGGWYLQPDCNMPSGESFVRQILIGKLYFKEKFGVEPTTAINFDPFGHSRGLVQILRKSGYDSYLFGRPNEEIFPLPPDGFMWVGFDGSEIAAHRFIGWYNSWLGKAREKTEEWLKNNPDRQIGIMLWGVGNHGGGPSRKDLNDLRALIEETSSTAIVHSTPEAYFAEMAASGIERPRLERDLNSWAPGCYTSQVRLKQKHRLLENELYRVEKMVSCAALQGLMEYPQDRIHEALRDLLGAEFHDILPGSSVQPVEEAGVRLLDHGLEIISRIKAYAFFSLASGQPKAKDGEIPILAYNPHPFPVEGVFECEFNLPDINWNGFVAPTVRLNGEALACQTEKEISNVGVDWRKHVVFRATLQPSQMNRFDCTTETRLEAAPKPSLQPCDGTFNINNGVLDAVVNCTTGLLDRYAVNGVNYIGENAFLPRVFLDDPDPWSSIALKYRDLTGVFRCMTPEGAARISGLKNTTLPAVRVVEEGAVRTVIEAILEYGDSFLVLTYKFPKQGAETEIHVRVHWNEKDKALKLAVPSALEQVRYLGQVAFGHDDLTPYDREVVAQKWVAMVSDKEQAALTCINDGSYGSDFVDNEMRLTLLRGPAYSCLPIGDHPLLRDDAYTPRIDQGERQFRFWLNAGPMTQRLDAVDREALVCNEKPFLLSFYPSGAGKSTVPGVLLSDDVTQLVAFKKAERSGHYILRLFEPAGVARSTTLRIPALGFEAVVKLGAFEVKTFRLDPDTRKWEETDLLERPV